MTNSPELIRKELIAQNELTCEKRVRYEKETQTMINNLEIGFRREKWGVGLFWGFATIFVTTSLAIAGYRNQLAPELQLLAMSFVLLIFGSIEVVKHFINRSRVQVLKELKSIELQLLEMKSSARNESSANP